MKSLKKYLLIHQAARLLLPLALVSACFYLLSFAFDEVAELSVSSTSDRMEGLLTASSANALFAGSAESQYLNSKLEGALPQQAMPLQNLFALDNQMKGEQVANAQAISNTDFLELKTTADWFSFDSDYTLSAAWGDVDNDGDLDLAVGNYGQENKLYLNQDGRLEIYASWQSEEGDNTGSVAWGDVDGDGDLDLAVGNHGPWLDNLGRPNKLYLNGNGQLEKSASWQSEDNDNSHSVAWGDVNGDGKLDLAVGNWVGPIKIYLNQGQELEKVASWRSDRNENVRSVAWGDVDGDGDLDLATANWEASNKVYLNQRGELEEVASWSSNEKDISRSVAWGDVDGDGDLDLAVGNEGRNRLYLNQGGELEKGASWFSNESYDSDSVTWGDLNGDGKLDLAVANRYGPNTVYLNLGQALSTQYSWSSKDLDKSSNVALADVDNDGDLDMAVTNRDGSNKIYKNNKKILSSHGAFWASADSDITYDVAWGDMDNDGDLDLAVANTGPNLVYKNTNGKLEEVAIWSSKDNDRTYGTAWGDMDNDGYLDLAVANWQGHNRIYRNQNGMLNENPDWSSADNDNTTDVAWADYDGDGDLDLAVANWFGANKLYLNKGTTLSPDPFWVSEETDYSWSVAWGDIDNDGDLDLAVANSSGPNKLYQNQGGQLEKVASWKSNDADHTYGVAWGDVDSDGYLDLAVANNGSPNKIYLNKGGVLSADPFWFSKDSDFGSSVAWGDMDNDGDLDLAVGNRDGFNKVYLNQNGTLTSQAFWASDDKDITNGIAWGDVDGDGDLDLASGNLTENKIYLNQRFTPPGSPAIALRGTSAVADFYADPKIIEIGIIPITYTLFHPNSEPMQVRAFYSLNGGGKWLEAKPASETKSTDLESSPSGVSHTYLWDSGFFGQSDNVVFRLKAQASLKPRANTVPGPFQYSYVSAQTYPFGVRGSQVRVLNASQPVGNALVYRLPAEQIRDGKVLGKSPQEPFRTNSGGYLQGRGELAIGDTLVAMLPLDNGLHSFDGHDDYVEIDGANGRQFNSMTNSITVEAVMKPRLLSRDGHIVNRGGGWDESGYSLFLYGKKIRVELQNSNTQKQAIVDYPYPDDNQCHHVAFTWDSGSQEIRTYIDGQLQREIGHFEGPIDIPEQKLNIGRNESQDGYYFDGLITEVRLWKVARSQEELQRDINQRLKGNEVGLVGYWLLNEQTDGVTDDQSSSRNHGKGQGQLLNNKETIVKQDPCAQSYTLYYTSATPSEKGMSSYEVKQLGVQTVTVSADNSLLLFNLDISLEWDARQDQFMKQLEYDLRRVSELLYDWTDGQAALGELTIYHDRENWHEADIRIYATNRLRPNADIGGIVKSEMSEVITDSRGISSTISYKPGQLRMGVIWNRYGNSDGTLGEDWPRALAHELGHYLFFLNDNYLGFDEQQHLVSLEGCPSAMSDPYREDYSEFVTADSWEPDCKETLSQRPDWETISKFYPLQPPTLTTTNPGPHILPLYVTKFNIIDPQTPPTTLQLPIFYLTDQAGKRVIPSKSARAYLFRGEQQIISLGSPVLDQVIARGASPGERLCLYDLEAKRLGCEQIRLGHEQIELKQVEHWQPDVIVSPVTSQTIEIEVAGELPKGVTLEARFFGIQNHITQTITLTPEQHYRGSFDFSEPTLAGYIHVRVINDEHSREIVTSYGLGGAPIQLEIFGAGQLAPVISPDGQVILYGDKLNFAKGEFLSLQNATKIAETPPWGNVVGDAYRLIASQNLGQKLFDMSITFNYLEQDVLAGEEESLRIYYRAEGEESKWQALTTTLDIEHNFASASIQGAGLYALISGLPIKLETGWNLFAYPLWTTQPITKVLAAMDGKYTIVCGYDREDKDDPWKIYRAEGPAEQNDLQQLEYGRGYWIKVTEPITLSLRGVEDQARFTNTMIRDTLPPAPDGCEASQKTPTTLDIIYIVQPDDTMYRIAKSHQTTVQAIRQANYLPNAYLEVGQRLIIPAND